MIAHLLIALILSSRLSRLSRSSLIAMALATAPVTTTALCGGRRIFLDLHPLEMRPLDSVAKAHRRSTSRGVDLVSAARDACKGAGGL